MMSDKPHRIRVRVLDGKPREPNRLKSNELKMPHLDVIDAGSRTEFVICAVTERHLEQVRGKLAAIGLEEIPRGDTSVAAPPPAPGNAQPAASGGPQRQERQQAPAAADTWPLPPKPYGFVALPENLTTAPPVWHDGTGAAGRLSGEIRFEIEALTPLLVGWERRVVGGDGDEPWPVPASIGGAGPLAPKKPVLCPLRAPWGNRPVIIPGDSLKGLLRHELAALLGAPMERVAERSYSYRPNSLFPKVESGRRLVPRLARVPEGGVEMRPLQTGGSHNVRVPARLDLLSTNLKYDKNHSLTSNYYRFDGGSGTPYRGGQGAGEKLNSSRKLHSSLIADPNGPTETVEVPSAAKAGYLATLRHLTDLTHGHFSERHPDVSDILSGDKARDRILKAAGSVVFRPGDLIWVEWDIDKRCIVSLGWHYYYRWAYTDSVRWRAGTGERQGLFPLEEERALGEDGAPKELSAVRRLFGYTGDNDGSAGIGKDDHAQLMGRISVNAGIEVVADGDTGDSRFLPPTFLTELGLPRPSAVEHYIQQPYHPGSRPSDRATLVTYGDASGYDNPGALAGRKFYLDRQDAYSEEPWKDDSPANRANERSTLALEASCPGRCFRFTVRFRDLDPAEVAAIVVALCPHQFHSLLGGAHPDGYCSKLGYARPLGWGTVRIEARKLLQLATADGPPALRAVQDLVPWVEQNHQPKAAQAEWLAIHRCKHPSAADYPREGGNIYTFHAKLRAEHSRARRYRPKGSA